MKCTNHLYNKFFSYLLPTRSAQQICVNMDTQQVTRLRYAEFYTLDTTMRETQDHINDEVAVDAALENLSVMTTS